MTVVRYMDVICEIWCKIFNLLNLFQRFDPFPSLPPPPSLTNDYQAPHKQHAKVFAMKIQTCPIRHVLAIPNPKP